MSSQKLDLRQIHALWAGRRMEWFSRLHPVVQALLAGLFTWGITAVGATSVFGLRQPSKRVLDGLLGFASGVMLAASYWSLLAPAISMAEEAGGPSWLPPAIGFVTGGLFLAGIDRIIPHLHIGPHGEMREGPPSSLRRSALLVIAITLHNIPEGLAVGVAFGAIAANIPAASLTGAVALAVGIGLQNLPEGLAVAMPLRREGISRWRSFSYGQASALVEPVAAVAGAALVGLFHPILPYALAFAAGAMVFVVAEELIPEAHSESEVHIATGGLMVGFTVMMVLDVALG